MKSKRKEITKYNVGGYLQAGLGTAQTLYGLTQLPKARAEFERARAAAPSLETPAQFYENYRNAYDSELARMQDDMIQRNLATSVQALQGAGGRALVGGLSGAVSRGQAAQMQMLAQERGARMQAGQQLATAEERAIGRKEARSTRDIQMANKAMQAALGNIGAGLGSIGTGLMYGLRDAVNNEAPIPEEDPNRILYKRDESAVPVESTSEPTMDTELRDDSLVKKRNPMMAEAMADQWFRNRYGDPNAGLVGNVIPKAGQPEADPSRNVDFNQPPFSPLLPEQAQPQTQGHLESVASSVANSAPWNKFDESVVGQVSRKDFDKGMLGEDETYTAIGDQVFIRKMTPQQKREKEFFDNLSKIGGNVLTGSGMQSVVGNLKKHGGMMTSGEFNHATNPIDIVQNGEKVGEATGNEYIINPTQAAKIAKESSYAKKLFKLFERKAKKNK